MSAPTPAPGDDRPREGYYPDPSIPGYVRYWNGASWVPGTSRPAPKDGEPLTPPPGVHPASVSVEETGPHFFDEDPADPGRPDGTDQQGRSGQWAQDAQPAQGAQWGRPGQSGAPGQWTGSGPAGHPGHPGRSAQFAHPGQPAGAGGDPGLGAPWGTDPRMPADPRDGDFPNPAEGPGTDGPATAAPAADGGAPDPGTFIFRRPIPGPAAPRTDDGTMTFRPAPPGPSEGGASGGPGPAGFGTQGPVGAPANPGFGAGKAAAARAASAQPPQASQGPQTPRIPQPSPPPNPAAAPPSVPQQAGPVQAGAVQAGPVQAGPPRSGAPGTPLSSGSGGGQASWAQQVHQLAGGGDEQPVAPWKPPVEDPFQAAARRQAAARPAGLGKRLAARLIDLLVVGAVTAVAAVPLGIRAVDHAQEKIDAARVSGHEVTVWLLDGTTGAGLGIVLGVLLLAGVLYEVLPTVKWGRTLGKKLCGLQVRDIEGHEPPTFGPALRRWLVLSVPGLLVVGVVGVLWCLFDRPWHQCWHDKAAHTFVAG
ncbi:RDD family protein [Streptomyces naphthomycinicus]|uniref:RDD family protein n=1 Tax=Streptomyces naphthomycinicus TaxID=2872625 RepID=UPI001CEDC42F|nr:RDD family protein [Streptomyces sp. TML10]